MINLIHNSFIETYRHPFGALPMESQVLLKIYGADLYHVELHTTFKEIETVYQMEPIKATDFWEIEIEIPKETGVLNYYFKFNKKGKFYYYGTKKDGLGGLGQVYHKFPPFSSYQITIYNDDRQTPKWYKEGLMYQIFPDRFHRGSDFDLKRFPKEALLHPNWSDCPHYFKNEKGEIEYWDFFGGTLSGITEKLDYLKTLNVSVVYLNPIFKSKSNHRYDTGDYLAIDPILGDLKSFQNLMEECKKRDIHIILDGVFSHTGDDSLYFNRYGNYDSVGAFQSKDSPYYDWYSFSDYPMQYASWWGIENMPNTDEVNLDFQNFIFGDEESVIRYWMKEGVDGWRLDVADELPDSFIQKLKESMLEEKSESVLIGEVWENATRKIAYGKLRTYFSGYELDSVMNYPFRSIFIDFMLGKKTSAYAIRIMMSLYEDYPKEQFMSNMNLIGSHDRKRILTILGEAFEYCCDSEREKYLLDTDQLSLGKQRLKILSLLQMTFPGVPCIYYGDEVGLQGFEDPHNRCTYPWGKEDEDLLEWYQIITKIRADYPVFQNGDWKPYESSDDLFVFERKNDSSHCLCLFNRNVQAVHLFKDPSLTNGEAIDLITGENIDLNPLLLIILQSIGYCIDEQVFQQLHVPMPKIFLLHSLCCRIKHLVYQLKQNYLHSQ